MTGVGSKTWRGRAADVVDRSFWIIPAAGLALGAALGFLVPTLDGAFDGAVGPFALSDPAGARGLLEVIATVTVSVAGLSFSVTVVAVQLASQQLSPRVLRTFQRDRLNKATLSLLLGTFAYCLIVLARLGVDTSRPNLSLTVAIVLAAVAFGMFAAFIHNIVVSLQASTVIRRIAVDAEAVMERPYPAGRGEEVDDDRARSRFAERTGGADGEPVRARRGGYLTGVDVELLIEAADEHDGAIVQRLAVGDFVVSGATVAEAWSTGDDRSRLAEQAAAAFVVDDERTLVEDVAFPVRQFADIALRALSPSLNDPTTAENAMGSLADALCRFARAPQASDLRAGANGEPRFLCRAPDLDDLVRLGFEQVSLAAAEHPVVRRQLIALLDEVERAAAESGSGGGEIERQRRRLRDRDLEPTGPASSAPGG